MIDQEKTCEYCNESEYASIFNFCFFLLFFCHNVSLLFLPNIIINQNARNTEWYFLYAVKGVSNNPIFLFYFLSFCLLYTICVHFLFSLCILYNRKIHRFMVFLKIKRFSDLEKVFFSFSGQRK